MAGVKERLKRQVDIITNEKAAADQKILALHRQNMSLKSSLLKPVVRKSSVKTSHIIKSSCMSAIMPSLSTPVKEQLNTNVRTFTKDEVKIQTDKVLGCGVFGKCFLGFVGPIEVCIKVSKGKQFNSSFIREANVLSSCCHSNICFLLGFCMGSKYTMIALSYHGLNHRSYSLHSILVSKKKHDTLTSLFNWDWKYVLFGIISGLDYLHKKGILHNDIKEDNVILEEKKAVIIDFGKACFEKNAKKYNLTNEEKKKYALCHPHIAPDLRDGICLQSKPTDVFSFGRLLLIVSENALPIPSLVSLSKECMEFSSSKRPKTNDLFTFLSNLL